MLVVGELQPLMDSSPSQDENPAISAFSRVLYTTKVETLRCAWVENKLIDGELIVRELNSGDVLGGRYTIISKLGGGSFGRTYIAQDMQRPSHPKCVVKQLKPENSHPQLLETAVRLFNTEAETLELLGSHPQIPQLLAHFQEEEEFFVVQELIGGESLAAELKPSQRWPESKIVDTLQDILEVLEFIHNNNVIHRDIKPDNIIRRTSDKRLVLVDFGSVKQISGPLTYTSSGQVTPTVAIGTQGYMPTEQTRGKPRPNSDIYALGVIGIQAATGLKLHQLDEDSETGEIDWKDWAKETSDSLKAILEKMTKYHFRDRYQSAREILEDLAKLEPESQERKVKPDPEFSSPIGEMLTPPNKFNEEIPTSSPNPTLVTNTPHPGDRNKTVISPRPIPPVADPIAQINTHSTRSHSTETNLLGLDSSLIDKLKISGVLGSGSWFLIVCLTSLIGTVWIVSGSWLLIAAFSIFMFFAREKQLSDKFLWLTVAIISAILAVFVMPSSLSIGSLLNSNILGLLVFLLIALFSFSLAFIILTLLDFLPSQ
jgi:serine/threonine protein kinase